MISQRKRLIDVGALVIAALSTGCSGSQRTTFVLSRAQLSDSLGERITVQGDVEQSKDGCRIVGTFGEIHIPTQWTHGLGRGRAEVSGRVVQFEGEVDVPEGDDGDGFTPLDLPQRRLSLESGRIEVFSFSTVDYARMLREVRVE